MRIVICRPTDQLLIRDQKFARTYHDLGLEVVHLGNRREMIHPSDNAGAATIYAGFAYGYSNIMVPFGNAVYQMSVIAHLRRLRPDYIHAGDFEGLLGAVIYKKVFSKGCHIVYDIADSYVARYNVPHFIADPIQYIDDVGMGCCDAVILPQSNRYGNFRFRRPARWYVVPNCPFYADAPMPQPVPKQGGLRVLASGWIRETRGMRQLVEAAKSASDVQIVVVECGNTDHTLSQYLRESGVVEYHSAMPQRDVLRMAQSCHLVAALYEPSNRINRQAAPNKVYDAMATARPVLVNSEIDGAEQIVDEYRCGFAVPYHDVKTLASLLRQLKMTPGMCDSIGMNGRKLFEMEFNWEAMSGRIEESLGIVPDSLHPAARPC